MDEISAESLKTLLHRKIKIEVNNRVILGELISVEEDSVTLRTIRRGMVKDIQIDIDEIDAILFFSRGKQTEP